MQERSRTRQSGNRNQTKNRELITLIVRLSVFVTALIPLAAMALPWITLDGTGRSGERRWLHRVAGTCRRANISTRFLHCRRRS